MGQRGAGRRLRWMKVDQNHVLVLLLNMAPRTTNSWLPRPPYPPSGPRRQIVIVVARHNVTICRVILIVAVHLAVFGRRSTLQQGLQFPKRLDCLQKASKVNANVDTDIRKMSTP